MAARLEGFIGGDSSEFMDSADQARDALGRFVKRGDKASRSSKSLSSSLKQARASFNAVGKAAATAALRFGAVAAAATAATAAAVAVKSINLAREQIKVEKQLAAAIRSTGGAAGLTADELKRHASALQKVTNIGDEVTIGAQAMLLTFTRIGRDVFPEATEAVLNVATAMKTGLKESATLVGKALNDPIRGLTALNRVGITFTQTQKDLIKVFQESGRTMEAQKIILKELEIQFGGSARAVADPLIQLGNVIGDVGEEIGKGLIPIVNSFANVAIPVFERTGSEFTALFEIISKRSKGIEDSFASIGVKAETEGGLLTLAFDKVAEAIREASKPLAGFIVGLEIMFNTARLAANGIRQLAAANRVVSATAVEFVNSTQATRAALRGANIEMAQASREGEKLKSALTLEGVEKRFIQIAIAIQGAARSIEDIGDEIDDARESFDKAGQEALDLAKSMDAAEKAERLAAEQAKKLAEEQAKAAAEAKRLSDFQKELSEALDEFTKKAKPATDAMRKLGEAAKQTGLNLSGVEEGLFDLGGEMAKARERALALAQGESALLLETARNAQGIRNQVAALRELIKLLEQGAISAAEFAAAQRDLEAAIRRSEAAAQGARTGFQGLVNVGSGFSAGGGIFGFGKKTNLTSGQQQLSAFLQQSAGLGPKAAAAAAQGGRASPGTKALIQQFQSQIQSRHFGGFLNRSGAFNGQRGEFVIKRSAAQAIGPDMLRRLNRGNINVTNNINATDKSTMGSRAQIRAILPELRRQTKLGVLQGGPF